MKYENNVMNIRQNQQFLEDLRLQTYFVSKFNNLVIVDTQVSKWGCLDLARTFIVSTVRSRQQVVGYVIAGADADHARAHLHQRDLADARAD